MRKLSLVAGLAVAALIPSFAFVQSSYGQPSHGQSSCEQQRQSHVVGTVAGVGFGAALGAAIAPRGDRAAGAAIGAVGGGVIGNAATRPDADCAHAYGYYDHANQWHANAVSNDMARGYYDRDGAWVDGAPNGSYDSSGRWMASDASGYYDHGRWIAGPADGAYDVRGRWIPGAANGHRDPSGAWVVDAQPGYYDDGGHWRAGMVMGHYDDGGRWVSASTPASIGGYGPGMGQPHRDTRAREAWIEQRIHTAANAGALNRMDASRALNRLDRIRQRDADLRDRNGRLSRDDEAMLQARLDRLNTSLALPTGERAY